MLKTLSSLGLAAALLAPAALSQHATIEANADETKKVTFTKAARMMVGQKVVKVDLPGYAAPCWADVTGDGKKDLLVGQFHEGRIKVYPGLGKGKIGDGQWLMAGGEVAKVDGVW